MCKYVPIAGGGEPFTLPLSASLHPHSYMYDVCLGVITQVTLQLRLSVFSTPGGKTGMGLRAYHQVVHEGPELLAAMKLFQGP